MMKQVITGILTLAALSLQAQTLPVLGEWDFTRQSEEGRNGNRVFTDISGHGNFFEGRVGAETENGLALNVNELIVGHNQPLPYMDMRQAWEIETTVVLGTTGTEQVFVCKEGRRNSAWGKRSMMPYLQGPTTVADLSLGFDNTAQKFFVEVRDADDNAHRLWSKSTAETGRENSIISKARYFEASKKTTLELIVNGETTSLSFKDVALQHNAGRWVIGRGYPGGFPNALQVRDGRIKYLRISGEDLPRVAGQNPLFTDRMTADPAITVVGDRLYAYVGEDCASPGGWFSMPRWLCYSTTDMRHWTAHGEVLSAAAFPYASPGGSWAGQVVENAGKFYYYVTLDKKQGGAHTIDVAVSDSPTGPFLPARKDGSPLVTDEMTPDSHRANADIDPTVLIDDDGTPWMAWGNGDCYLVRLKRNMIELDGEIRKVPMRNYSEGPFLIKRRGIYYMIYASDAPGVQPEQMAYSYTRDLNGSWTFGGYITGSANHGFTIHPSVNQFKGQWYFFYHDGSYSFQGEPGGDCRRQVCAEPLYFNKDGTIRPIPLTVEGVTVLKK